MPGLPHDRLASGSLYSLKTQRFYNPLLSEEDVRLIEILKEGPFAFSSDGESLFLC
ncbi:hypothetical protein [Acetomicrobium sp. S15 = DSM 107314]|uniref:hypothetical protein n=1 Tax=Acetomicrobium sp. S15 = DSM 107314 TaxID=2529858 RepID=UPI001E60C658|nr:hypothetical protein [Acetomicrobium sp. S15 = DSM 107314]